MISLRISPFMQVGVVSDWGLSNTSAAEYGNSKFNFLRMRRPPVEQAALPLPAAHMARDVFRFTSSIASIGNDLREYDKPGFADGAGFVFDATRYIAYENVKAAMRPSEPSTISLTL